MIRHPGLCAGCAHLRVIESGKGSTFFMCRRGLHDPSFPKYPPVPVLECRGFERHPEGRIWRPGDGPTGAAVDRAGEDRTAGDPEDGG